MQTRAGERAIGARNGVIIDHDVAPRVQAFLAQQRLVAVATVSPEGHPWASLWLGEPGFVTSPGPHRLVFDDARRAMDIDDEVRAHLRLGAQVGVLAIDLATRRRIRINGIVTTPAKARLTLDVREAYPNCPKYIRRRILTTRAPSAPLGKGANGPDVSSIASGRALDEERIASLQRADVFFVASHHPERGADASHRGGPAGFIHVLDARTLRIPDYAGNGMFNTLGNFAIDPRAGLVIPDFTRGRFLQLQGSVSIEFADHERAAEPTGGTHRYWTFHLDRFVESPAPTNVRWEHLDASPYDPVVSYGLT